MAKENISHSPSLQLFVSYWLKHVIFYENIRVPATAQDHASTTHQLRFGSNLGFSNQIQAKIV